MELLDYLRLLRRRVAFVLIGIIAGLVGGYVAAQQATPLYTSQLRLIVSNASPTATPDAGLLNTLGQIVDSVPVEEMVLQASQGTGGFSVVSGPSGGSSSVLVIAVSSRDPLRATAAAASYATVLPAAYAKLQTNRASLKYLDQTPAASAPLNKTRTLLVGLLLGIIAGLGGALLREALDTAIRTPEELTRRLGHEVIATVPGDRSRGVVTILEPLSGRSEAYRRIRAELRQRAAEDSIRTLLVTSAASGEGKTTTLLNVAAAAAQAGERVIVVDADLRRPSIADATATRPSPGLTDVLLGTSEVSSALQTWGPLTVLTAGATTENPVELLGSRAMRSLLAHLGETYDLVLVDSPAMLPIADAEVLAADCDAVLFVSRLGLTSRLKTLRATRTLERLGRDIVGIVANFATGADTEAVPRGRRRRERQVATPLAAGASIGQLSTSDYASGLAVDPGPETGTDATTPADGGAAVEVAPTDAAATEPAPARQPASPPARAESAGERSAHSGGHVRPLAPTTPAPSAPPAGPPATPMSDSPAGSPQPTRAQTPSPPVKDGASRLASLAFAMRSEVNGSAAQPDQADEPDGDEAPVTPVPGEDDDVSTGTDRRADADQRGRSEPGA